MPIPVTIEDARRQLRLEETDESRDAELQSFIDDAADRVERLTGLRFVAGEVEQQFRGASFATLSAWPIKDTAVPTISYVDDDGQRVTIEGRLDVTSRPARVTPAPGTAWPFVSRDQRFKVTIRAGYEPTDTVPAMLKRAMLILISAFEEDREGGDLFTKAEASAIRLCDQYRVIEV